MSRMTPEERAMSFIQKIMTTKTREKRERQEQARKRERFRIHGEYPTRDENGYMLCHVDNGCDASCGQRDHDKRNNVGCPCFCHQRVPNNPHADGALERIMSANRIVQRMRDRYEGWAPTDELNWWGARG